MKFKCCDFLLHEIVFAQSEVIPCCCSPTHNYSTKFIRNFNGSDFDFNEYITEKHRYIEQFKNNDIPDSCKGCSFIREQEWEEQKEYIQRIIISNRTKCSCNCTYCSLVTTGNQTKQELNTREAYNVLPALKAMHSKNLFMENCLITVAGGECSEYPQGELETIVYIAQINKCRLEILSSGIIYSKAIEKALALGHTILKISVDSGTKDTYEKIKQVKAYSIVWDNLKKYIQAANNTSTVVIKYILLPGINDNADEAKAFVKKCRAVGCRDIELAAEYLWFEKNKNNPVSDNMSETVRYLKNQDFNISFEGQSEDWLKSI